MTAESLAPLLGVVLFSVVFYLGYKAQKDYQESKED